MGAGTGWTERTVTKLVDKSRRGTSTTAYVASTMSQQIVCHERTPIFLFSEWVYICLLTDSKSVGSRG